MIHLDTTFLVDAIRESRRGVPGNASRWLAAHRNEPLGVSLFVLCELLTGAELHAEPHTERQRVRAACAGLPVVLPDERLPTTYARTLTQLTREGETIATMDLLIAGMALDNDAAVLTRNERHFHRVPGLRVISY